MKAKINFIEGNTKICLMKMVVPMIVLMFLDMAYNLVDSLWVGNLLGETAYAALTNAMPIVLILVAIALGTTNGFSILISQSLGSKKSVETESLISTSFIISIIFTIVITIILELTLPTILKFLNTPIETYGMAYSYLAMYILGYTPVFIYLYFSSVLRSFGDLKFQVYAMLLSVILNVIIDPIFIIIIGFKGAAIATVISQIIALFVMIIYIKNKKIFTINIKIFDKKYISPLVKKAIPSVIQQSIPSMSMLYLTYLISSYGITPLAAYGITGKVERILLYPSMALNMVLTVIIGQCIGGNRMDRAKDYLKEAIKYSTIVLSLLALITIIFSKNISYLFVRKENVAIIVSTYFCIVALSDVLNTITNCFLGFLNGIGKPSQSMMLMIIWYILIRMPLTYIISIKFKIGLDGIWVAILISNIIISLVSFLSTKGTVKMLNKIN